jgi:hypothetical protein
VYPKRGVASLARKNSFSPIPMTSGLPFLAANKTLGSSTDKRRMQ